MTFILLTGAAFSYNWGGPLASDVFSALLADTSLDTHTRDLLFDSGGAFEKVLADLHVSADPDDQKRHDALITALAEIFNGMNNTFMHVPFEFENPPSVQHSMAAFLKLAMSHGRAPKPKPMFDHVVPTPNALAVARVATEAKVPEIVMGSSTSIVTEKSP